MPIHGIARCSRATGTNDTTLGDVTYGGAGLRAGAAYQSGEDQRDPSGAIDLVPRIAQEVAQKLARHALSRKNVAIRLDI